MMQLLNDNDIQFEVIVHGSGKALEVKDRYRISSILMSNMNPEDQKYCLFL